jgi:hypothetical protein
MFSVLGFDFHKHRDPQERACIGKAHPPQEKSQKFLKNKKLKENKLSKISERLQIPWGVVSGPRFMVSPEYR